MKPLWWLAGESVYVCAICIKNGMSSRITTRLCHVCDNYKVTKYSEKCIEDYRHKPFYMHNMKLHLFICDYCLCLQPWETLMDLNKYVFERDDKKIDDNMERVPVMVYAARNIITTHIKIASNSVLPADLANLVVEYCGFIRALY
jgi:hypothetical protein